MCLIVDPENLDPAITDVRWPSLSRNANSANTKPTKPTKRAKRSSPRHCSYALFVLVWKVEFSPFFRWKCVGKCACSSPEVLLNLGTMFFLHSPLLVVVVS